MSAIYTNNIFFQYICLTNISKEILAIINIVIYKMSPSCDLGK